MLCRSRTAVRSQPPVIALGRDPPGRHGLPVAQRPDTVSSELIQIPFGAILASYWPSSWQRLQSSGAFRARWQSTQARMPVESSFCRISRSSMGP
jgi:hypothetical protein